MILESKTEKKIYKYPSVLNVSIYAEKSPRVSVSVT